MAEEGQEQEAQPRVLVAVPIRLTEDGELPTTVTVHQVGEWRHPWWGTLSMTRAKMNKMVRNFNQRIAQPGAELNRQLHIDVEHKYNDGRAVAWVDRLKRTGDLLQFTGVRWNNLGREALENEHYMYMSAEYYENYTPSRMDNLTQDQIDEETGRPKSLGPLMIAAALTNRPFVTDLPSIMNSAGEKIENKEDVDDDTRIVLALTDVEGVPNQPQEAAKETDVSEGNEGPEDNTVDLSQYVTKVEMEKLQAQLKRANEREARLTERLTRAAINKQLSKARDRGVAPAVLLYAEKIYENCDPEAERNVSLTVGDKEEEHNLFSLLSSMVANIPVMKEADKHSRLERPFEDEDEDEEGTKAFDKGFGKAKKAAQEIAAEFDAVDLENAATPEAVYGDV